MRPGEAGSFTERSLNILYSELFTSTLFGCVHIIALFATAITPKSVGVFDLAERILLHAEVMAKLVKERVTNLGEEGLAIG